MQICSCLLYLAIRFSIVCGDFSLFFYKVMFYFFKMFKKKKIIKEKRRGNFSILVF